jgi:ERCC4-type nuclease
MALPRLNENPQYELVIPSTKEKVNFRPFLVKEQKVLLIAYESQDRKQILSAMLNTLENCIHENIDVKKLSTFDVDYMFTMIRSKSAGETTTLLFKCKECQTENEVVIKLDEIGVDVKEQNMRIDLTDKIAVKMRYPSYEFFLNNSILMDEGKTQSELLLASIVGCLEAVETEEERIDLADESEEEVNQFLESLTASQFEKISEFALNLPAMSKNIKFACKHCETKNERMLRGLEDFF